MPPTFRVPLACCAGAALLALGGCVHISSDADSPLAEGVKTGAVQPRIDFTDPVLNQRQIILTAKINELTAHELIAKLLYLEGRGHQPIDLLLASSGGHLNHTFAIIDVINSLKSKVNTWAVGDCNSGGAMLLAAGTGRRKASPNAVIIIHGPVPSGRLPSGLMETVDGRLSSFWQARAKLPARWLPLPQNSTHVLTPRDALEYGLIDEAITP
jgi:ATP-dependent Clp protease, protease subunit